ncbi:hypothetical protein CHEID_02520 [Corynebacterium heidelbergense]|nr:hypothetical protein CHEID_02520 [Corynebacterium heidelbergense]
MYVPRSSPAAMTATSPSCASSASIPARSLTAVGFVSATAGSCEVGTCPPTKSAFPARPGTVGASAVPPKSPESCTSPFTEAVASGAPLSAVCAADSARSAESDADEADPAATSADPAAADAEPAAASRAATAPPSAANAFDSDSPARPAEATASSRAASARAEEPSARPAISAAKAAETPADSSAATARPEAATASSRAATASSRNPDTSSTASVTASAEPTRPAAATASSRAADTAATAASASLAAVSARDTTGSGYSNDADNTSRNTADSASGTDTTSRYRRPNPGSGRKSNCASPGAKSPVSNRPPTTRYVSESVVITASEPGRHSTEATLTTPSSGTPATFRTSPRITVTKTP